MTTTIFRLYKEDGTHYGQWSVDFDEDRETFRHSYLKRWLRHDIATPGVWDNKLAYVTAGHVVWWRKGQKALL